MPAKKTDAEQVGARQALLDLFNANQERVFYSRQFEVLLEDRWFHWITNRALHQLIEEGLVLSDPYRLSNGVPVFLVRHRGYRYHRRESARVLALIDEYSHHDVSRDVGWQGEALVLEGFVRNQFVLLDRNAQSYGDKVWTDSNHDLDFVLERDGVGYGVEVKNQLGYMDHDELVRKTEMCRSLGLRSVFAVRMLPKDWINEVIDSGGFALIMKYQLYPKARRALVERMREELELPVDTPGALFDGTMKRFLDWHEKNV
ncbi:MAG: hypothetical protein V3U46_03760 [Acidimicrobiia bacterium]